MGKEIGPGKPVLLVDDEAHILATYKLCLKGCGIDDVLTVSDSREVMPLLASRPVALIVLDLHMPHISGTELLPKIIRDFPQVPAILVSADDEIETVVGCMKTGALDYLVKPVESGRLLSSVRKALELSELSSVEERLPTDRLNHPESFAAIVTQNKKMRALFRYIEIIAGTRHPIMIIGETGTGKELVAKAIHELSGCSGEYVALNVAGLDDTMFSDTLFGHMKGAFTGALQARDGMIARAGKGTLFLDEIGDLNASSQLKLLRLLQENEYYPVGSDSFRKSDARIVLATNHDLQRLMASGEFRNDLYFRLCAHQIHIPPLRERLDDLPLLIDHFLTTAATELRKKKPTPPKELTTLLSGYSFPGNIRELEALLFDAVARHSSRILSMDSFRRLIESERPFQHNAAHADSQENVLSELFVHYPTLREMLDYMVNEAMALANGNQSTAASLLGMRRHTLNKHLNYE